MNDLIAVALKALFDKVCKGISVPVGEHDVDQTITLRVVGNVTKIADEEYTPTTSIPYKKAFEMFLARMGFQREAAMAALVQSMTDAINGVCPADVGLENYIKVDEAEEIVRAGLQSMPAKIRSGKTFVDCTMAVVDVQPQMPQTLNAAN